MTNQQTQILKQAMLYFLRSSPKLAAVIPAMDHIDKEFTTYSFNTALFSPPICAPLELAKKVLSHYYTHTDESHLYRITMGEFTHTYSTHFFLRE